MVAAEARRLEAVNYLVDLGATYTNRDKHGKSMASLLHATLEEEVIGNPRKLGIQMFPNYPCDNLDSRVPREKTDEK